jgi:hypothetical protein
MVQKYFFFYYKLCTHYNLAILDIRMPTLSILPNVKTTNDIIKKPVALDDFINAVKTVLVQ